MTIAQTEDRFVARIALITFVSGWLLYFFLDGVADHQFAAASLSVILLLAGILGFVGRGHLAGRIPLWGVIIALVVRIFAHFVMQSPIVTL